MFSRFFIERPVLSNVLALVMVLIGAVALLRLPVSQYPNVTPPTVSVTTRYPGASAKTVIDTVALPIEQQVNGVERMLYMQSTSASDGTYSADRHLRDRHRPRTSRRCWCRTACRRAWRRCRSRCRSQGVTVQKKSTAILQFVTLTSPDEPLRQPVHEQLRGHQPAERAGAPAGRRQRQRLRRRPVCHAHLDGPADQLQARGLTPRT